MRRDSRGQGQHDPLPGNTWRGQNEKKVQRASTLESNVFVGSGAKILGPITVGANSRIGANSAVLKDVPKNATVTGMRARIIKIDGKRVVVSACMNPESCGPNF